MIHSVLLYPLGLWLCHATSYAGHRPNVQSAPAWAAEF